MQKSGNCNEWRFNGIENLFILCNFIGVVLTSWFFYLKLVVLVGLFINKYLLKLVCFSHIFNRDFI